MKNLRLPLYKKIYIVGAHSRARTMTEYLRFLYPHLSVEAYLVDRLEENASDIDGVPVVVLRPQSVLDTFLPVFIATKGIFHADIIEKLEQIGFQTIFPVTPKLDNLFRNAYVEAYFKEQGYLFQKLEQMLPVQTVLDAGEMQDDRQQDLFVSSVRKKSACIYMARSIYDRQLKTVYEQPDYERAIQVGAALTDKRLEEDILTDCEGENISSKNRQYCELTALYWIWKHAKEEVVGLSHYRRHFILPVDWQELMLNRKVDVLLPVPACVFPCVSENYRERHTASDWDFLMKYLKENYPEDYVQAEYVFAKELYLPCNMLITRKEILDDLCAWMFPILDAVTEHGGVKTDSYQNRYAGFISERLITLYFYKNRNRYKIAYVDKCFIS